MARAYWLSLLLAMGCAHAGGDGPSPLAGGGRAAAQRLYTVAEERYAAGAYAEAVELMRHSILQLPPSPEHDRLRHQLVLRMAHTQLRDHAATTSTAPLHDARQMLARYLERHEALFGQGQAARAERGEVYELLYLVERGLEQSAAADEALVTSAKPEPPADALAASLDTMTMAVHDEPGHVDDSEALHGASEPAPARTAAARTTADEPEPEPSSSTRRTDADGNEVRDVIVRKKRKLASLDDPRVLETLKTDFPLAWAGLVLTKPGVELVHGSRPLVRGTTRLAGRGDRGRQQLARRAGRTLLQGARETLRGCYADAFARRPVAATESAVEASIHPDGSISHVRIVDGGLVDGYGDACVIEALQAAGTTPLPAAEEPVRVHVALQFFYESPVYIVESTGEQLRPGDPAKEPPSRKLPFEMSPIERFAR